MIALVLVSRLYAEGFEIINEDFSGCSNFIFHFRKFILLQIKRNSTELSVPALLIDSNVGLYKFLQAAPIAQFSKTFCKALSPAISLKKKYSRSPIVRHVRDRFSAGLSEIPVYRAVIIKLIINVHI